MSSLLINIKTRKPYFFKLLNVWNTDLNYLIYYIDVDFIRKKTNIHTCFHLYLNSFRLIQKKIQMTEQIIG